MKTAPYQRPLLLAIIVVLMLVVLSFVPAFRIGDFSFRTVDAFFLLRNDEDSPMLADVMDDSPDFVADTSWAEISEDSTSTPAPTLEACADGLTCMEDFTPDKTGINKFLQALSELKSKKSKSSVRIAFYGDSFIEGDIFCGSVRDTLQTLFGGRGVGYVPITSHVIGFRNTVKQQFGNWKTYSIINKPDSGAALEMGPAGYSFIPQADNWVEFTSSRQRYLRQFESLRVYYRSRGTSFLHYTLDDTLYRVAELKKSRRLREWKKDKIHARRIELEFEDVDSLEVFGVSFEGEPGVYVDNFGMRGNSGIGLYGISPETFKAFNRYRDYKLIILQYGLNAINFDSSRYSWYADRMVTVINRLKEVFPKASIVLLSVSDRSSNVNGRYRTEKTIPTLRDTQRRIAQKTGIVFWDLYEAMGGENSMVKFVRATPALAAKDYTHLTFKGGKKLAGELVGSILFELEKYEQQELP